MPRQRDRRRGRAIALVMIAALVVGCAPHFDQTIKEAYDDVSITTRVKAAIAGEGLLSYLSISVETFKGVVLLSGFVDSEHQRKRAIEVAKGVSGVREVKALLVVKYLEIEPGSPIPRSP